MRTYLLPEEGHAWLKRDFSAQEMRIMSHFAEGKLYQAFLDDSKTDPHTAVQKIVKDAVGIELERDEVKVTGFGIIYGRGIASLANALGIPEDEAKRLRDAYFTALPEVKELSRSTRNRGMCNQFIRTWGGRVYYREPDEKRDLSYKLLNYLVQGSGADQTKQAVIDYNNEKGNEDLLLAVVHDEINISAPKEMAHDAMQCLKKAMNADRFDVPFESEGYAGPNWGTLTKVD
jgi:DNA polymerase I-like protein with 3'-5' exonuclease and polymerase domains